MHPDTLNTIEPYYDKFKLQEVCRECEKIYNLRIGVGQNSQKEQNVIELRQGNHSFQSWIKANLREELVNLMHDPAQHWRDAQSLAGKYGLEIREHKTGLVFSHVSERLFVKASSVDRSFSKKSMEDRFGKFEPATQNAAPTTKYQRSLIGGDHKENALYAAYQTEMTKIRSDRREQMKSQAVQRSIAITEIKERYAKRRQQVQIDPILTRSQKCVIRKSLSVQMKEEIDRYYKDMQAEKNRIWTRYITKPWREWLHDKAKAGDETALAILKQRPANRPLKDFSRDQNCNVIFASCSTTTKSCSRPKNSNDETSTKYAR